MKNSMRLFAAGVIVGLSTSAGAITTDGDWSDWFAYSGNVAANTWNENLVTLAKPSIRAVSDEEGPTPGGGGQRYDIEEIFYTFSDNDPNALSGGILRIGMVTGFPPEGRPLDDLYAGDMFIDFGNTGDYALAVATSTSTLNAEVPGGVDADYFGNNYVNDGTPNWVARDTTLFHTSAPWRVDRNASIENQFSSTVAWGQQGVHYFLEIEVAVDAGLEDILTNAQGGLGLHWTPECGNDVIAIHDDTPLDPFSPVPEPSSFILLGIGTAAMALRKKFSA